MANEKAQKEKDYKARLKSAGINLVVKSSEYHRREMLRINNMTSREATVVWKTLTDAQKEPYLALHQADCQRFNNEKEEKGFGKGRCGMWKQPVDQAKLRFRKWTSVKKFGKRSDTKYVGAGKVEDVIAKHDSTNVDRNSERFKYFQLLFGPSHVVHDYIGWVTKMKDGVHYHPILKKNFAYRMPHVTLEYVKFTDFSGPKQIYSHLSSGGNSEFYHLDGNIEAARQASNSHYTRSGFDRTHFAVWQNWTRHLVIVCLSFHLGNAVPALPSVNACRLEMVERNFRQRILEEGHGIIISTTLYEGPPEEIKWLEAENEDPIPIPTSFGKLLITRRNNGVHIRGWKILNQVGSQSTPLVVDSFSLMTAAGCPFTANSRQLFSSIEEGKTQRSTQDDPSFLKFTPKILAYRDLFDNVTDDVSSPSTSSSARSSVIGSSEEDNFEMETDTDSEED